MKTGQVLHHDIDKDVVFRSTYLPTSEAFELIKKINDKTKASKNDQFYFVGSQIFNIDDEVKGLLTKKTAIAFGRSIDTKMEPVIIPLRNEYADNVMLFGINDEEQVSRTTMASIKSLRISNKDVKIKIINCLPTDQKNTTKMLKDLASKGEIELLDPSAWIWKSLQKSQHQQQMTLDLIQACSLVVVIVATQPSIVTRK